MKKKLYIGCALTHVPLDKKEAFFKMIREIKTELGKYYEIVEFLGIDDLKTDKPFSPLQIYEYDIKGCLMKADYFLAICDYYGLGLGYELGAAVEKRGMPVLAIAQKDLPVSRLIRGIDHPNYEFITYEFQNEIVSKVLDKFPQ